MTRALLVGLREVQDVHEGLLALIEIHLDLEGPLGVYLRNQARNRRRPPFQLLIDPIGGPFVQVEKIGTSDRWWKSVRSPDLMFPGKNGTYE